MPLSLEPGQGYPIVLDSDTSKPVEVQPTFFAKSQSMRGQQIVGETLDLWSAKDVTVSDLFTKTCDVLSTVLVGWKNMGGIEFSKESLADLLTYSEARELLRKVMYNQHITADEKKSIE
jgi:hypothetical protein